MTYKVFANGNPLQASEINLNLMQQAIAVFTDATAREAAIAVPVNGQFAYLTGTSNLTKYTGAAWVDALSGSPITTEGDLLVGDAAGSPERLAIGANDQIFAVVAGVPTWVDAGGGGLNTITEVTATNSSFDTSAISGFARITLVGAGAGGSFQNQSGSSGGFSRITISGAVTTAVGGDGFVAVNNVNPFVSGNGGYGRAASSDSSQNGYGGAIKTIYADLTGISSVNIVIGAGGAGGTGGGTAGYDGSSGLAILEYAV